MTTATLDRIILSFPTLLSLNLAADPDTPAQSWVQLAVAGSFVSKRYGEFAITPDDLRMMAANFRPNVTPIDYDHLTQDPQRPFDGIAAGWFQRVELRDGGGTLWGEVSWTPKAAEAIKNREYQFISPSFVKDYTTPTGDKIGTKLLGAALTNMPFLPDMAAVTLGADAVFGQFAVSLPAERSSRVHHLAEIGQRVTFLPDPERTPELTDEERQQTFVVKAILGDGDDQVVRLVTVNGVREFGWFRVTQLAPADAAQEQPRPLPERTTSEDTTMQTQQTETQKKAAAFAAAVKQYEANGLSSRDALQLAQHQDEAGAMAYRLSGISTEAAEEAAAPVLNLSARSGESFDQLAQRYALEQGVSLRQAIHEVGKARPDLAAAR
jgi:hypothetical protein